MKLISKSCNRAVSFLSLAQDVSMFDTVYDYESITHYAANAFSINKKATISSKEPGGGMIMVRDCFVFEKFDNFW
jgi:hypothetical protein